jgi:Helicase HerA, central domain
VLNEAYNTAMRHKQILEAMGLQPVINCEKELWDSLNSRFGGDKSNLPHLLILDNKGLHHDLGQLDTKHDKKIKTIAGDTIHASSKLLSGGVPFADRKWVCISTNGDKKYVAVMVLEDKPEGFWGDQGQIQYLWSIFAKNDIYDVEIITQITPSDQNLARLAQQLLTRNALSKDVQAQERGVLEVSAQINTKQSVEAQRQLYTGDKAFNTSVVVLIYRDSPKELEKACRYLSGSVAQPAKLEREMEYTWLIWLQTLGIRKEDLLSTPYYRRLMFFASELSGVCNLVTVCGHDKQGFELLAHEGGSPVYIDFRQPKNLLILGTTGSGKSVLVASVLCLCLALDMSIVIIDLPNSDGTGTFGDFTPFFNGIYFDISKESNNLMQLLDVSQLTNEEEERERIQAHRNDVILILNQLILGSNTLDGFLIQTIESLIPLGIAAFYQDSKIQERFEEARKGGLNSLAWKDTPTLADLINFFSVKHIKLGNELEQDTDLEKALNHIRLRLNYWLSSPIGEAIGKPSTFDLDSGKNKLITFALTNLQSDKEAEIFGLSAYLAARRQSLSTSNSVFFMDEASVLLKFSSLSRLVGRLCATARKSGCRIVLAGQDVDSIAESERGQQILQNTPCRLIGRTVAGASSSYEKYLGIPKEIVNQNENFQANRTEGYTRWLLDYKSSYTHCRYYPSYPMLALTANSREEQAKRNEFKAKYPNKFEWLTHFWHYYKDCLQQGKDL